MVAGRVLVTVKLSVVAERAFQSRFPAFPAALSVHVPVVRGVTVTLLVPAAVPLPGVWVVEPTVQTPVVFEVIAPGASPFESPSTKVAVAVNGFVPTDVAVGVH